MNFRLDLVLTDIYYALGPAWLVASFLVLYFALTGSVLRGVAITVLLLLGAQSWFAPAYVLGRNLRWWVLVIVCARGVLAVTRARGSVSHRSSARGTAVALGAVALISTLWADSLAYSFGVAMSFTLSIVVSFVVLWHFYDLEDVLRAATRGALVLGALVFCTSHVWMWVAEAQGSWELLRVMGAGGRMSGIFFNANMLGILAMILVPTMVAAPRTWLARLSWLRWPTVAAGAACLFMSGSRSAIIGCALALGILLLYRFRAGAVLTMAMGAVGAYVVATSVNIEDVDSTAFGHITRTKHISTLSGRLDLWQKGLDAIHGRELLGLGWGGSRLLTGADTEDALARGHVAGASNLHSTHVQILVDVGALGLVVLWLFCLQVLVAGARLLAARRTERSSVIVMVLGSFVAALADSFVHGSVLSTGSPSALIFWGSAVVVLKEAHRMRVGAAGAAPRGAWTGAAPPRPLGPGAR